MTGVEQLIVWLFGIFCASLTVCSTVKAWAQGRVDVATVHARAHVDAHRVVAEAQHGTLTVPTEWTGSKS